jgi:hypothetical protein
MHLINPTFHVHIFVTNLNRICGRPGGFKVIHFFLSFRQDIYQIHAILPPNRPRVSCNCQLIVSFVTYSPLLIIHFIYLLDPATTCPKIKLEKKKKDAQLAIGAALIWD